VQYGSQTYYVYAYTYVYKCLYIYINMHTHVYKPMNKHTRSISDSRTRRRGREPHQTSLLHTCIYQSDAHVQNTYLAHHSCICAYLQNIQYNEPCAYACIACCVTHDLGMSHINIFFWTYIYMYIYLHAATKLCELLSFWPYARQNTRHLSMNYAYWMWHIKMRTFFDSHAHIFVVLFSTCTTEHPPFA